MQRSTQKIDANLPLALRLAVWKPLDRLPQVDGYYDPETQVWSDPLSAGKTTWCQTSTTGRGKGSDPDNERDDEL
jgi:hypothetical protein